MYRWHGAPFRRAPWNLAYQAVGGTVVAGPRHKRAYSGARSTRHLSLAQRGRHRRESAVAQTIRVHARRPLARHGARFTSFGVIGAAVFAGGLLLQQTLVREAHCGPLASYVIQVSLSIQVSFLLNRWWTWRDRRTPFATALWRFNVSKVATTSLNFLLYAGLVSLKVNYLSANLLLTVLFTIVNYLLGDSWTFGVKTREDSLLDSTA